MLLQAAVLFLSSGGRRSHLMPVERNGYSRCSPVPLHDEAYRCCVYLLHVSCVSDEVTTVHLIFLYFYISILWMKTFSYYAAAAFRLP